MSKVKTWVFTLNNYTDDEIKNMHAWQTEVNQMVVAREVGENGTPHLQGQFTFKRAYRLAALKKLCPRAHWEPAKAAQDSLYCMKSGSEIIFNVDNRKQGSRSDLKRVCDSILSGETSVKKLRTENPFLYHQYGRTLEKVEDDIVQEKVRDFMTEGFWYWGETGTGKSQKAYEGFNTKTHYVWKNDKGWQDLYNGQEIVIIDDFRGEIPYAELLKLIDRYPCFLPRRGKTPVPFLAKKVIVTCPMPPEKAYPRQNEKDDSIAQLKRRFVVTHFAKMKKNDDSIGSIM